MNAYGYSGYSGYGGDGQMYNGGKQRSHRFCIWTGTAQASDTQTELLKASIIAGKHREIGRFRHTLRHVTEGFRRAW